MSSRSVENRNMEFKIPKGGVPLELFMRDNKALLMNKNIFYVVEAKLDRGNVCKFGVAFAVRPQSSYDRLKK